MNLAALIQELTELFDSYGDMPIVASHSEYGENDFVIDDLHVYDDNDNEKFKLLIVLDKN